MDNKQVEQEKRSIMKQLIAQGFIPEIAATLAGVSLNKEELQALQKEYVEYITNRIKEKKPCRNSKKP